MARCNPINYSVLSLNQWKREGTLRIPDVQRSLVWTIDQKRLLIDSLLREYDVPKIYFQKKIESGKRFYDVYDGQQRLDTIYKYFENNFSLSNEDPISIDGEHYEVANRTYDELDQVLQVRLQETQLTCVILEGFSQDEVEDMFLRLQHGTPLNAPEKRRAINGNMRDVVKRLADHGIFKKENFLNYDDRRYAFEDSVAKVLHQFIHQDHVSISPAAIRKTYEANSNITINHSACVAFNSCANWIIAHFPEPPLLKKFSFITLFWVIREMKETYAIKGLEKQIAQAFLDFELERHSENQKDLDDRDPVMVSYSDYARSDSPPNMLRRSEILIRYILGQVPSLSMLDEKRDFDQNQRYVLFRRSNQICQSCEKDIKFNSFHADHVVPFSHGGRTSIENGQALCKECNLKKGASTMML